MIYLFKVDKMRTEQITMNTFEQKISTLLVSLFVCVMMQQCNSSNAEIDKSMMQAASELNKTCPVMVDQETRLDNAIALPGHIFQYNYTFINMLKDSIDFVALQKEMEPTILNGVKTSPALKKHREKKVTMSYRYVDKKGVFLFKIAITPDQYKD